MFKLVDSGFVGFHNLTGFRNFAYITNIISVFFCNWSIFRNWGAYSIKMSLYVQTLP